MHVINAKNPDNKYLMKKFILGVQKPPFHSLLLYRTEGRRKRTMAKKIACLFVIICLCIMPAIPVSVEASVLGIHMDEEYGLMYVDISKINCSVGINGDTATVNAMVRGKASTVTSCSMTIELQEKVGFLWITKSTWSVNENGHELSIRRNCKVTSGKTYRAKATAIIYTSSGSESASTTSSSQTAP